MLEILEVSDNEFYNRGITFYDHGQYAEAIVEFQRVLEFDQEDESPERRLASFYICEAYANLGLAHLRMGMFQRASDELKKALNLHPEYADLNFYLAIVHYKQGRYHKAEKQLQKALSINPRYAKALMYLGLARLRKGSEDGLASIEEAVTAEPAFSDDKYEQALSMYREGARDQVLGLIEEVAEIDVDQIRYLLDKGLKLFRRRKYADAANVFLEASSICPHYADVRNYLGTCYMRQGILDLAIGQFVKALEINPEFISARVNLATAYEKDDQPELAVEELNRILMLDPRNPTARRKIEELRRLTMGYG